MRKKIFTMLAAVCSVVALNAQNVSHTGDNATSYDALVTAISSASSGDIVKVEAGIYTAGATELTIPQGVTVIGGFVGGFDDAHRVYPGGAAKDKLTILDGNSLANTEPTTKHRVATVQGTLEGCVIRNGHARGNGGGVLVENTGTVLNCIIKGNVAMDVTGSNALGGGAYLNGGKLINCVVAYNMANNGYGVAGNGEVINNTITANTYAPTAVEIEGGSYQHFKHWRDVDNLPWAAGSFNSATHLDAQNITISAFHIAQTQTTTSQYAVFAAAMDFNLDGDNKATFADNTLLPGLTDPTRTPTTVADYMGFTASDVLFQANVNATYGLQYVGQDFIYPANCANEAMTYVSWYGALAYSLWLGGSLPTEGQWEYAARFNKATPATLDTYLYAGSNNLSEVGHFSGSGRVQEVMKLNPNNADIYDMTGNVWEWCADKYDATGNIYPDYTASIVSNPPSSTDPINNAKGFTRVRRGGSWGTTNGYLALAFRNSNTPTHVNDGIGFRPVFVP